VARPKILDWHHSETGTIFRGMAKLYKDSSGFWSPDPPSWYQLPYDPGYTPAWDEEHRFPT
jgi:hypothetical protein